MLLSSSAGILWHWGAAVGSRTVPANGTVKQHFLVTRSKLSLLPNIKLQYVASNLAKKTEDSVAALCGLAHGGDGIDK